MEMQKVALRVELEKANMVIANLKFQVEESKEIVKCNILCKYEEEVISLRKELEEAKANEEPARLNKHQEEEIASLRSKEQLDANIENLHSQITKANKIIVELNLPREEISILELRWQIEESKKIKEALSIQVTEKDASYCKLKEEVVSLKMKLEEANKNVNKYSKFEKRFEILDQMMKQQRDSKEKSGLGYVSEQPSTSKSAQKKPKDESENSK